MIRDEGICWIMETIVMYVTSAANGVWTALIMENMYRQRNILHGKEKQFFYAKTA